MTFSKEDNANYAIRLPFEIWRECFLLLHPLDHKILLRTCRLFYDICLPFVFKSISYSSRLRCRKNQVPADFDNQLSNLNANISRLNAISSESRLATLVRSINLHYSLQIYRYTEGPIVKAAKDAYTPFVRTFVQSIPKFINVQHVHIEFQKNMDKAILTALSFLPHLESVTFSYVRFGAHTVKPRLNVKTLVIDNTRIKPDELDPNPNSSAKLLDIISVERIESIQSYSWSYTPKLFRALTKQGTSSCLSSLTIQLRPNDLDVLSPFLGTCPNLSYLNIDCDDWRVSEMPTLLPLSRSVTPRLKYLRCPYVVAKAFGPGRAITEFHLTHPRFKSDFYSLDKIRDIVPHISCITSRLTTLDIWDIMPFPESFGLIAAHLSGLQTLRLGMGFSGLISDEDFYNVDLGAVVPRERLISGLRYADSLSFNANAAMLPFDLHTKYMDLIYCIALKKVALPPALKVLELRIHMPMYLGRNSEAPRIGDDKVYTIRKSIYIFHAMSTWYPELKRVEIDDRESQKFQWCKDAGESWMVSQLSYISLTARRRRRR